MKKFMFMATLAFALVTGLAVADPASRIAAFNKATGGTNLMAITFGAAPGTMTNTLKELAAAGWTDDAVIATMSFDVIRWALAADKAPMTESFVDKLLAFAEGSNRPGVPSGFVLVNRLKSVTPLDQQVKFRSCYIMNITYENPVEEYAKKPVRAALLVDKAIGTEQGIGRTEVLKSATIDELIALRLAPELRTSDEATIILDKATAGAKKALRAEGKSFVSYTTIVGGVTNVVNPLTAKLAPVVVAINAPLMTGLEGALATCGITVASQNGNRAAMQALSDGWKNAILDGEVAPPQQAPYLAALKVSLGVEAYNAMIKAYNGEK